MLGSKELESPNIRHNSSIKDMVVSSQKKQTEAEKKLKTLKVQLYGKETLPVSPQEVKASSRSNFFNFKSNTSLNLENHSHVIKKEENYLRKDLLKIIFLALLIFGAQFLLYFGFKYQLLPNFF